MEAVRDVHICGACQNQFAEISSFVAHIRTCVKRAVRPGDSDRCRQETNLLPNQTPLLHIPEDEPLLKEHRQEKLSNPETLLLTNHSTASGFESCEQTSLTSGSMTVVTSDSPVVTTVANDPSKLTAKYKKVTVMGSTRFRCTYDLCSFTSQYLKDLERHYRIHTGEKPYQCWQCGKRFSRKDKLKIHQMAHKGEKPFKCLECNYATNDNSSLVKHRRVHTGERPYKCQICPYASRNASQLVVHLRTHTGDTPFHCRLCSMKFKINSDLKRHTRLHTGEKPYACTFCSYRCSIKGNLNAHMRSHVSDSPLHCDLCEFVTTSRKDLREHERVHQDRPFQCLQCNYTATSQSVLTIHLRTHSQDMPFKCLYCNFTSRQSCNVRTHIKKKHPEKVQTSAKVRRKSQSKSKGTRTNTKPVCRKSFKCKICKSGFVRFDSLRCHLRQHQAESLLTQRAQTQAQVSTDETITKTPLVLIHLDVETTKEPCTSDIISAVPSTIPQENMFFTNTLQESNLGSSFGTPHLETNSEYSNANQVNSECNISLGFPTQTSTNPVLSESVNNADVLEAANVDCSNLACNSGNLHTHQPVNVQTLNTLITSSSPMTPANEIGVYQIYQLPNNVSFVTLPVVSSASSQNTLPGNVVSNLGDVNGTSLISPSPSTLLHVSGLGPNVQYVISPSQGKLNADNCL